MHAVETTQTPQPYLLYHKKIFLWCSTVMLRCLYDLHFGIDWQQQLLETRTQKSQFYPMCLMAEPVKFEFTDLC
jgi:hypothetical protein